MLYTLVTSMSRNQKQAVFAVIDMLFVPITLITSLGLAHPSGLGQLEVLNTLVWMGCLAAIAGALGWSMGLTRLQLNAYEARGMSATLLYSSIMAGAAFVVALASGITFPLRSAIVFGVLTCTVTIGWRILLRHFTVQVYRQGDNQQQILIYGAGKTGRQLLAALREDRSSHPVGFVDDNPALHNLQISGAPVFPSSQLLALVQDRNIDKIVMAMPSTDPSQLGRLANDLRNLGCEVHKIPSFEELIGRGGEVGHQVSPVSVHDLLGRNRLEQELPGISHTFEGQSILVTGAGGSIGSELCRHIASCKPRSLVLLDHSELALYNIEKELSDARLAPRVTAVLGSVSDRDLMHATLAKHGVNIVLHAAAYKHVPMVESNPLIGLSNNVLGTKTIADSARELGVDHFILVSSDKAVRPTNVMGASKRLAELVVQDLAQRSPKTIFSMVRFGNVLGSSGSVVPLFEEQIARGGPVTVTHPDVTRFFMTIPEAARLVLLAGSFAQGGEVFVLDMGDPIPIRTLARRMIEGVGLSVRDNDNPKGDIEIAYSGLRPGEKLHEELLISSEMLPTPHHKILRAQEVALSEFEVANVLKDLRSAVETRQTDAALAVIARWVEQEKTGTIARSG